MLSPVKAFTGQRLAVKISIVLLLSVSFYIAVCEPLIKEAGVLSRQVGRKSKQLARYKQLVNREADIEQAYARVFSTRQEGPGVDPFISALKELEGITQRSAIKVVDMRQSGETAAGPGEILIELKLEAKKEAYVKFIYDLGSSQLLFNIRSFNLKAKEESALLEADFRVSYTLVP